MFFQQLATFALPYVLALSSWQTREYDSRMTRLFLSAVHETCGGVAVLVALFLPLLEPP